MNCIIAIVIIIILYYFKEAFSGRCDSQILAVKHTHTHTVRGADIITPSLISLLLHRSSSSSALCLWAPSLTDRVIVTMCVCVLHYWSSPCAPQHTPGSNLHPHWLPAHQASLPDSPPPSADWTTLGRSLGMRDDAGWGHTADQRGWCHLTWALWLVQNDPQTRGLGGGGEQSQMIKMECRKWSEILDFIMTFWWEYEITGFSVGSFFCNPWSDEVIDENAEHVAFYLNSRGHLEPR